MIDCKLTINKHGEFEGIESVKRYVTARYPRWEDFSKYSCEKAGIPGESIDVLNEVVIYLLQKDENNLIRMCRTKSNCGKYMEIDILVLGMIRLNVFSPTSPYQHKYKRLPVDREVNFQRLQVIDEPYDEIDKPGIILKQMRLVRWIFSGLDLTEFERRVFNFRFFEGNALNPEWPWPESRKQKYETFQRVEGIIHYILFRQGLTKIKPKRKLTSQQSEIVERWFKTHKINVKQSEYSNN
jgi:hypothetical protein